MNKTWKYFGAEYPDWAAGFCMFVLASLFVDRLTAALPMLIALTVTTVFASVFVRRAWFSSSTDSVQNSVLRIDFILHLIAAATVIYFASPSEQNITMIFIPILVILSLVGWKVLSAKSKD